MKASQARSAPRGTTRVVGAPSQGSRSRGAAGELDVTSVGGGVLPRILTIMGSGETSPTMVKVHRAVLAKLGPPPVRAALLDTPFGFQENADELCAKAVAYFDESLHVPIEIARYRSQDEITTVAHDATLATLRAVQYVFAGPGSPTYALRQWKASLVPALLTEKLAHGGAVTFASAAAVTLGAYCAPIYEIYKVGDKPCWLEGIDLLGPATGMSVAVIPHYNNAEGGTHDTRYCYLGERRLSMMEEMLPEDCFVIGIDEHTALIVDLDAGSADVVGHGVVTVRRSGRSETIGSGETVSLAALARIAGRLGGPSDVPPSVPSGASFDTPSGIQSGVPSCIPIDAPSERLCPAAPPLAEPRAAAGESPFVSEILATEVAFRSALDSGDVEAAVRAVLELDHVIADWATETFSSDERARAHGILRSLILDLGGLAAKGAIDRREIVGPYVDALLVAREEARGARRFDDADRLRDLLTATGVEVRDTASGSQWNLA